MCGRKDCGWKPREVKARDGFSPFSPPKLKPESGAAAVERYQRLSATWPEAAFKISRAVFALTMEASGPGTNWLSTFRDTTPSPKAEGQSPCSHISVADF
jgi:hypothetical protein